MLWNTLGIGIEDSTANSGSLHGKNISRMRKRDKKQRKWGIKENRESRMKKKRRRWESGKRGEGRGREEKGEEKGEEKEEENLQGLERSLQPPLKRSRPPSARYKENVKHMPEEKRNRETDQLSPSSLEESFH
jgi:hypothetical protein